MNKNYSDFYICNELAIGKAYFEFASGTLTPMNDFAVNGGEFNSMYQLIVKYLVSEYDNPLVIMKLLKRHLATYLYFIIYKDEISNNNPHFFNDIKHTYYKKDTRIFDNDSFNDLFNCPINDFETISKELKNIRKIVRESEMWRKVKGVDLISYTILDYFGYSNRCADIDVVNRFDLMVSKEIHNPVPVNDFLFQFDDNPNIVIDLWNGKPGLVNLYAVPLLGFIIDELFKQNCFDFTKNTHFNLRKEIYYLTMLKKTGLSTNYVKFISQSSKVSNEKVINIKKIVEFNFIYNNINYRFTKKGIVKK